MVKFQVSNLSVPPLTGHMEGHMTGVGTQPAANFPKCKQIDKTCVKLNINNIESSIPIYNHHNPNTSLPRSMKRSLITDRYIPNFSTTYILRRLTLDSIIKILKLWQTLEITQTTKQKRDTLDKFLLRYDTGVGSTIRKAYVIDLVIHLYPKGLNLLHISILETQLIFESKVTWRRSDMGQSMDINQLQENIGSLLSEELSKIYMNHVYVTRNHQEEDGFLLIRVQLFDTEKIDKLKSQSSIFFIIPQNTSYIVHNSSALFEIDLMLQLLSKILGTLIKSDTAETVGCLKTILKLNSHDREELGVWNIYNQQSDEIDISPFDDLKRHESLVDRTMRLTYEEQCKELSWLRFKGTKRPVSEQEEGHEDYYANEYPFQSKTFKITKPPTTNSKTSIKLRFKFKGSDIFAGLHELTDLDHLQIQKIPAWMTGENGFTGDSVEEIDETDEIMELKQNTDGNSNKDKGVNYGTGKGGMLI